MRHERRSAVPPGSCPTSRHSGSRRCRDSFPQHGSRPGSTCCLRAGRRSVLRPRTVPWIVLLSCRACATASRRVRVRWAEPRRLRSGRRGREPTTSDGLFDGRDDSEPPCKDEARIGQKGSIAYVSAPVGSRPPMVRDNRHDSAYLFGAICPQRGVGAAIIVPAVNAEAMNEHLREISTQVAPDAHGVLVCDGAGWHQTGGRLHGEHHPAAAAAPYAGVEPDGERLRIPPCQQALHARLGQLRRHRRGMPRWLGFPHQRPRSHPLNRLPRLGMCRSLGGLVLISGP
jgi:DDE superfamily endonuclease